MRQRITLILFMILVCGTGLAQTMDPVQVPVPIDTSVRVQWEPIIGPIRIGAGAEIGTGFYSGYGFPIGIPDTVPASRTTTGIPGLVSVWLRPRYTFIGAVLGVDIIEPAGGTGDYMKHASFSRLSAAFEINATLPGHWFTVSPRIGYSWLHESLRISRSTESTQGNATNWEGSASYRGLNYSVAVLILLSKKLGVNADLSACSSMPKNSLSSLSLRYRPGKKDTIPVWYGVGFNYCLVAGTVKYRMLSLQIGI